MTIKDVAVEQTDYLDQVPMTVEMQLEEANEAFIKLSKEKLEVTNELREQLRQELDTIAKLSTDYATLERQHQSVVADRNALEQRDKAGKAAYQKLKAERQEENINYNKETERLRVAEAKLKNELEKERQANDELRQLLMSAELNYARICGYVDGLADSKPPRMVEETPVSRIENYPRSNQSNWGSGPKQWYQK